MKRNIEEQMNRNGNQKREEKKFIYSGNRRNSDNEIRITTFTIHIHIRLCIDLHRTLALIASQMQRKLNLHFFTINIVREKKTLISGRYFCDMNMKTGGAHKNDANE